MAMGPLLATRSALSPARLLLGGRRQSASDPGFAVRCHRTCNADRRRTLAGVEAISFRASAKAIMAREFTCRDISPILSFV